MFRFCLATLMDIYVLYSRLVLESCWFVLTRVYLCWYLCIRIDLIIAFDNSLFDYFEGHLITSNDVKHGKNRHVTDPWYLNTIVFKIFRDRVVRIVKKGFCGVRYDLQASWIVWCLIYHWISIIVLLNILWSITHLIYFCYAAFP